MLTKTQRFRKAAWAFIREESGQSTTEYVLLLLFVVLAVKFVGKELQTKLKDIMDKAMGKATEAVDSADTN